MNNPHESSTPHRLPATSHSRAAAPSSRRPHSRFLLQPFTRFGGLATIILAFLAFASQGWGQTYYTMSSGNKTWDFADIANWGANFASGVDAANWSSVPVNATGAIPDGNKTTVSSATFTTSTSGGVQKGAANLYFLSTGSGSNGTATAANLNLNFTGRVAGTLSFNWACVSNSTGDLYQHRWKHMDKARFDHICC